MSQVAGQLMARRVSPREPKSGAQQELSELLAGENLQEMSKQRLIALISEQIAPQVRQLQQEATQFSSEQVDTLKVELERERLLVQSIEVRQEEALKLEQHKWLQQVEQLEQRLQANERELEHRLELHREHVAKLDDQYRANLAKLVDNFDSKLVNERKHFEEKLERTESLHKLELESKLNVDCNLSQLNAIQDNWKQMIGRTIDQLEHHFRGVQSLLDKQTVQVNGTNLELLDKAKLLSEQQIKFDQCQERVGQMAASLGEILPKFSSIHQENGNLLDRINLKLEDLIKLGQSTREHELELERKRTQLEELGDKLQADKIRQTVEASKMQWQEERLSELVESNKRNEQHWSTARLELEERERQLQAARSALDARSVELREQNFELHLLRKRLAGEKEQLAKACLEMSDERRSLKAESSRVAGEQAKLAAFRERMARELDQLRRVQESLVCSLCLGRLFAANQSTNQHRRHLLPQSLEQAPGLVGLAEQLPPGAQETETAAMGTIAYLGANQVVVGRDFAQDEPMLDGHQQGAPSKQRPMGDVDAATLQRRKQLLEAENKYVELLSTPAS